MKIFIRRSLCLLLYFDRGLESGPEEQALWMAELEWEKTGVCVCVGGSWSVAGEWEKEVVLQVYETQVSSLRFQSNFTPFLFFLPRERDRFKQKANYGDHYNHKTITYQYNLWIARNNSSLRGPTVQKLIPTWNRTRRKKINYIDQQ